MFFFLSKFIGYFLVPSNFVTLLGILGVALLVLGLRRLATGICVVAILLGVLAGMSPLGDIALAKLENRFPVPNLKEPPTGIIMLGGAVDVHASIANDTVALNDGAERITTTAELALRFPQARIFLSGGAGETADGKFVSESALAKEMLLELGIPADRISMEESSRTTAENALESFAALKPSPSDRWLLVTSAYHMPRAMAVYRAVGFDVTAYPTDFRTTFHSGRWEMPRTIADGFETLDSAAHEWAGLLGYRLGGRTQELLPEP